MKILLTGGTGFIAQTLGPRLVELGHEVTIVSRNKDRGLSQAPYPCTVIEADLEKDSLSFDSVQDIEAVIHLSGEGIADSRWSESRKKKILESRTLGTKRLIESFKRSEKLKVFIGASAIGFYGDRGEEECSEGSSAGKGFLSEVTQAWEESYGTLPKSVRLVKLRIGIVLGRMGGAFDQMLLPFQLGVGAPLGHGKQWMSWIHIQDLVQVSVWALENNQVAGALNCVAPEPARNKVFSKVLAEKLGTHLLPSVPGFVIKAMYGEMATLILGSTKVIPQGLLKLGFKFKFESLAEALTDICEPYKNGDWLFETTQYFKPKPEEVFSFFADAKNLEVITPPKLTFEIVNTSAPQMQKGTVTDFKLKLRGVSLKLHQTQSFSGFKSGTIVKDKVLYKIPMGFVGRLAAGVMVKNDLQKIFEFRRKVTHSKLN